MTPADLAKFEPQRRYATLVALVIEGMATVDRKKWANMNINHQ